MITHADVQSAHSITVPAIVKQVSQTEGYPIKLLNSTGSILYYAESKSTCPNNLCGIAFNDIIVPQQLNGSIVNGQSKSFTVSIGKHALDYGSTIFHELESEILLSQKSIAAAKESDIATNPYAINVNATYTSEYNFNYAVFGVSTTCIESYIDNNIYYIKLNCLS